MVRRDNGDEEEIEESAETTNKSSPRRPHLAASSEHQFRPPIANFPRAKDWRLGLFCHHHLIHVLFKALNVNERQLCSSH